jgi:hypothetical protein
MQNTLTDYSNPDSLGSRLRARRIRWLVELIQSIHREKGAVRILDVGGRRAYWSVVPQSVLAECRATISVLNRPSDLQGKDDALFTHVAGNACDLPEYADNTFDLVHSNSVIEHVGNWSNIKLFARESIRLAPYHFIQTPYFWFPVEPHFVKLFHHWLPRPLRVRLWQHWNMGNRKRAASLDEAVHKMEGEPYLLDQRMFRSLFPDSTILKERYFLFVKSLVAYRAPGKP